MIECECDCGDIHNRTCPKCEGAGNIRGKQIGEEMEFIPIDFFDVLIDYKSLSLIAEVMKKGGEWQMKLEQFKPCVFKTRGITIIVMPTRVG